MPGLGVKKGRRRTARQESNREAGKRIGTRRPRRAIKIENRREMCPRTHRESLSYERSLTE